MGLATVLSGTVLGVCPELVRVEVDARRSGMRQFKVVGLPESAVSEGRVRVETALANTGYKPAEPRITVNLAPAHLKKGGTALDLPIALSILAATGSPPEGLLPGLEGRLVVGELALDGRVRQVRGCIAYALLARRLGLRSVVVPASNGAEAAVVEGVEVIPVGDLGQAVEVLRGARTPDANRPDALLGPKVSDPDLMDVRGQVAARRALEVAAAGDHNLLMVGPPGAGKTMLARRLPGICPPLSQEERLEVSVIHSVRGLLPPDVGLVAARPFRAPHHTVSPAALVGGGRGMPCPGEVSLAHRGVLFLDEIPEFSRVSLESLRQPMESGRISVGRVGACLTFPADFVLVATMNPCPCGLHGVGGGECTCTPHRVDAYRSRVSGPLMDRVDLQVRVAQVEWADLASDGGGEPSATVRERVRRARARQEARNRRGEEGEEGSPGEPVAGPANGRLSPSQVRRWCHPVERGGRLLLRQAVRRLGLSARAFDRILKVARTLADLDEAEGVGERHIAEAVQYRLQQGRA